jgi:TnpA family transposase
VHEEVLVLKAARARADAIRLADGGEYDAAQARIATTAKELRLAVLAGEADGLVADASLLAPAAYALQSSRKGLRYSANLHASGDA